MTNFFDQLTRREAEEMARTGNAIWGPDLDANDRTWYVLSTTGAG